MSSKLRLTSLSFLILSLVAISTKADALAFSFCKRHPVTFFSLAATLSNLYQCNRAICAGTATEVEIKNIQQYNIPGDINQWLTTTSNQSASYSTSQQDAILQHAKTLAFNNRPPLKSVQNIQFFQDITVPNNLPTSYVIGAHVTYAKCNKRPPSS